jgi:hypothetical protein
MPLTWDGGEWEYQDAICATCRELVEDCICPPDYDENDEADQRFDCEREERD